MAMILQIILSNFRHFDSLAINIDESTYRKDKAISYSLIAKVAREGPEALLDEISESTTATIFGSLVDCLMTSPEEFHTKFYILDVKQPTDSIKSIVDFLYDKFKDDKNVDGLYDLTTDDIIEAARTLKIYLNYKPSTIEAKVRKEGDDYYKSLRLDNSDKIIIDSLTFKKAKECVRVLRSHRFTRDIFGDTDKYDPDIEGFYQLKFKIDSDLYFDGLKCMIDHVVIDSKNKTIQLYDLKTTSSSESEFPKSVLKWGYYIQASLYNYIIRQVISKDIHYYNYRVLPFKFIVINKESLSPVIYEFPIELEDEVIIGWDSGVKRQYKPWKSLLEDINWYYSMGIYDTTKELYENDGIIKLIY